MAATLRRRAVRLSAVALVVGVIVALLATGLGKGGAVAASPLIGRTAPPFTLPGVAGPSVSLASLRGQIVVINFWASWCAECQDEQTALDDTWDRFQDSGVVLVGIDFEDTIEAARDYVAKAGVTYPTVADSTSHTALAYGLRGIPETFLINRTGHVVDRIIGQVDPNDLAGRIQRLLQAGGKR